LKEESEDSQMKIQETEGSLPKSNADTNDPSDLLTKVTGEVNQEVYEEDDRLYDCLFSSLDGIDEVEEIIETLQIWLDNVSISKHLIV
jgi:hypothetical protein